jgi:molybdopterin molybdotransferase
MAQLSDDCFAFGGPAMRLDAALARMTGHVLPVTGEQDIDLHEADGHILAHQVFCPASLPPFDNSAVDGYAVNADDLTDGQETILPVSGRLIAGPVEEARLTPGTTMRVFTGAVMPHGADTVFMQEDVRIEADGRVVLPAGLKRGANCRKAGEDIAHGALLLPAGRCLKPADLALLAATGLTRVTVRRRVVVGVMSTGNELVASLAPLQPGQIRDANRPMLLAMLKRLGCETRDLGIVPDNQERLEAALHGACAQGCDLVISSGGVSTGEEDHVKAAVEKVGRLDFWRIGIKPGRPVAMGVLRGMGHESAAFMGLPGNPVACFVTFAVLARPLIRTLQGAGIKEVFALPVRLGFAYKKKTGRREYVRVRLEPGRDGVFIAHKHPRDGAGVITSLTQTDGLIALEEDTTRFEAGSLVPFESFESLLA